MERLPQRRSWKLPPLRVYLEDVEEIIGIVKSQCEVVHMQMGDYHIDGYGDVQELAKTEEEVLLLSIHGFHENDIRISVELCHYAASVYVKDGADTQGVGVAVRVVEVLHKRRKRFLAVMRNMVVANILVLLMFGGAVSVAFLFARGEPVWGAVSLGALGIGAYALYWNFVLNFRRYCVIRLRKAREEIGFIRRNKDDLVKLVLAALLPALFGALAAMAFSRIQCEKGDEHKAGRQESGRVTPLTEGE